MANAWINHVKKVAKDKGIKYNEALKVAGKTWKGTDKKQTKQDRLNEAEGKKKGIIMKKKQTVADRLDEAEGKKKGMKK